MISRRRLAAFATLGAGMAAPGAVRAGTRRGRGQIGLQRLRSEHVPGEVEVVTYLPPDQGSAPADGYPLLLLLHGGDGAARDLHRFAGVLDAAIGEGRTAPLAVAMPSAGRSLYMDYRDGSERWESFILEDLLPSLRKSLPVTSGRQGTFVGGWSMGGLGGLRLAFKSPGTFAAVASLEPAIEPVLAWPEIGPKVKFWRSDEVYRRVFGHPVDVEYWAANHPTTIAHRDPHRLEGLGIYLEVGDQDMLYLAEGAEFLHRVLFDAGVAHEYRLVRGAEHVGPSLAPRLADALGFIGRQIDPPAWIDAQVAATRAVMDERKRATGLPVRLLTRVAFGDAKAKRLEQMETQMASFDLGGTRHSRPLRRTVAAFAGLLALGLAEPSVAASCEALQDLRLPDTVIRRAERVPVGGFADMGPARQPDLPAFCRVVASVRTAPGSDIGVELWLPLHGWDGVFHGNGNGGFGGVLAAGYGPMSAGLRRGYATAVTDTGTAPATPLDGDPLIGRPQKWRDWGRSSTHAMTVTGKAIAQAFYGAPVRRAYYTGCSTGGQEGLIEALYYPQDYDGILVGAPVINRTWGHAAVLWNDLAAHRSAGARLSEAKLRLLSDAALARCGALGAGVAGDPFIADPKACRFDPGELRCQDGDRGDCLTDLEVATARAFYSGPTDKRGRALFHGWLPGSEATGLFDWTFLQSRPNGQPPFVSLFKWVFGPRWDWSRFQVQRDMAKVDAKLGPIVNDATRGSLAAFRARGGKLIIYHGWADSLVPPDQSVAFYKRAAREAGGLESAQTFARLFMAPGLSHCGGGPGPDVFNSASGLAAPPPTLTPRHDLFAALTSWVEGGPAPDRVISTRYVQGMPAKGVAMQRPLCAYPAKAWRIGDADAAAEGSFVCAVERPGAAD